MSPWRCRRRSDELTSHSLELSVYRAISLIAGSTAVPISTGTGWYGWSFWIPAMWCFISVLITLGYVYFDARVVPSVIRLTSNKEAARKAGDHVAKKRFSLGAYWLLPCESESASVSRPH